MTKTIFYKPDPKLDLVLERIIDIPRELVWQAWTKPEHITHWFTPAPWQTVSCEIDLRPGGAFHTVMRSPDGVDRPNTGCYLEIVPMEKLVFTDTLLPGFRPSKEPFFTAVIQLESVPTGTKYTAIAIHADEETARNHEKMGFTKGWGQALSQLVAHMKKVSAAH